LFKHFQLQNIVSGRYFASQSGEDRSLRKEKQIIEDNLAEKKGNFLDKNCDKSTESKKEK